MVKGQVRAGDDVEHMGFATLISMNQTCDAEWKVTGRYS